MEKAKISVIQLFALMFIFELGTALVVSSGYLPAKKLGLRLFSDCAEGLFYFLFTIMSCGNIQIFL